MNTVLQELLGRNAVKEFFKSGEAVVLFKFDLLVVEDKVAVEPVKLVRKKGSTAKEIYFHQIANYIVKNKN